MRVLLVDPTTARKRDFIKTITMQVQGEGAILVEYVGAVYYE